MIILSSSLQIELVEVLLSELRRRGEHLDDPAGIAAEVARRAQTIYGGRPDEIGQELAARDATIRELRACLEKVVGIIEAVNLAHRPGTTIAGFEANGGALTATLEARALLSRLEDRHGK